MKIPFDIKYRQEIEAGKYKVVTEFGEPARIICWDSKYHSTFPIIVLIDDGDLEDMIHVNRKGEVDITEKHNGTSIFILTDEPELTEFEKEVKKILLAWCFPVSREPDDSFVKEKSCELLTLAKETLEKEGWVGDLRKCYYKKGYEDAMRVFGEISTYQYTPPIPPCFVGGPCTNPQHDCINCPRQAPSGTCKTNTNIE